MNGRHFETHLTYQKIERYLMICFSFHINTIQHDLIVTTGVIITSTTIPERWLCIFIDRIFLFSLIYKCEMLISYVLDNVKSNK
jgi:hypothetical protein